MIPAAAGPGDFLPAPHDLPEDQMRSAKPETDSSRLLSRQAAAFLEELGHLIQEEQTDLSGQN